MFATGWVVAGVLAITVVGLVYGARPIEVEWTSDNGSRYRAPIRTYRWWLRFEAYRCGPTMVMPAGSNVWYLVDPPAYRMVVRGVELVGRGLLPYTAAYRLAQRLARVEWVDPVPATPAPDVDRALRQSLGLDTP